LLDRGQLHAAVTIPVLAIDLDSARLCLYPAGSTEAQPLPRSLTIGSNPPGTVFYALASGLAKFASDGASFQITVQPYTGTSTFLPLLNTGEIDFGINNAVDMALAYQGPDRLKIGGRNPVQHTPNTRLVMRGSVLLTAPLVRKDSPIKTIQDIRGKRVTGEYPAQLANWYNLYGYLAGAGMKWEDVKIIPVPGVNECVNALIQGRADVSLCALNAAKVKEADAAVGVLIYLSTALPMVKNGCGIPCRVIIRTGSSADRQQPSSKTPV